MKRICLFSVLAIISFTISSCTEKNNKIVVASAFGQNVKVKKDTTTRSCCTSNIPARFPITNANVSVPTD